MWTFLFPLAFSFFFSSSLAASRPPMVFTDLVSGSHHSAPIAILGDTQETAWFERAAGREHNQKETRKLLRELARESVGLIVHLGDAVFHGSNSKQWREFDRLMAPIVRRHTPVMLTVGNHEYWGNDQQASRHFTHRFPQLRQSRFYSRTYGPLGLIWLDSNRKELGGKWWAHQRRWFRKTLLEMENDSSLKGIFVFAHHPPFTNGRHTENVDLMKEAFVKPFLRSSKTLAFFSGHIHGYEHFLIQKKHFVISAGGGGPRVSYASKEKRKYRDLFKGRRPRPFHYLLVDLEDDGVAITMKGFSKKKTRHREMDFFELKYPN